MNIKTIKFILIIFTLILAVVEGSFLLLFPAVLNSNIKSDKVQKIVLKKSGLHLKYDKLKVKTSPLFSIAIQADNVLVYSGDIKNKEPDFSSKLLKTSVWLPACMLKKFKLNYFYADEMKLKLVADKDRNVFFANIPLNIQLDDNLKFDANLNSVKLENSVIILYDALAKQNNELDIENLDFYYKKNHSAGLDLKSKIFVNNEPKTDIVIGFASKLPLEKGLNGNKFKLDGKIKNLDLSDYSLYFSALIDGLKKVSGVINADFTNDKTLNITSEVRDYSIETENPFDSTISKSVIKIDSKLNFLSQKLVVDELFINSDDFNILVDGTVKNYLSGNLKSIKPDLNVSVKESDVHSLYWLVPSIKDDPLQIMQKLKKHGAWGIADGKIQIKGTALLPLIYGNLDLKDVYIVKNNPLVEHCKIFVEFLGDNLKLKTRVWAGYGEYVDIEGTGKIAVYGKGEFWVKSSQNVDLATAEYMLVPIHEIVGFDIGPVPYMNIKGKGNIDIHTKGTVLDGEVDGQFNFKNVDASLDCLNALLTNANGALVFNKKDMRFYTNSAFINKRLLKIDGKANLTGDIDFDVTSESMDIGELLNILNTSDIVESRRYLAEPIEKLAGNTSIKLKILGKVKDFSTIKENKTLVINGALNLKNVSGKLKLCPFVLNKINGQLSFDNDGWIADLKVLAESSQISMKGQTKNNKVDIILKGVSVKVDDLIKMASDSDVNEFKNLKKIGRTASLVDFFAEYKTNKGLSSKDFSINDVTAQGKIYPLSKDAVADFIGKFSGDFVLKKGNFSLKKFNAMLYNSPVSADLKISDILSKRPVVNGNINLSAFDLKHLESIKNLEFLPVSIKNLLTAYENYSGHISSSVKIKNNSIDGYVNLNNINFNHAYFKTPVAIDSGKIILDASKVTIKSMIANVDETPVFMNFSVWDFDKTMKINGYFTTKLTDKFANKYINSMLTYPVKPKGDITVTADINGTLESINLRPKLRIAPDADIYYMGANLGDKTDERELYADINVTNNRYTLQKLDYVRYMKSQNDKSYPLTIITANGVFDKIKVNEKPIFNIKNFNVQTLNNANVKIFNVLFKKSVLKNGMFNCKLNVKGNINTPVIKGNVAMNNIDMPLFETVVKNVSLKFNDKTIDIVADGEVLSSDFNFTAVMNNTATAPYVFNNIDIKSKNLDLDNFIDTLTKIPTPDSSTKLIQLPTQNLPLNVADVQIKKGTLGVENILIQDLESNNLKSEYSLGKDMLLDIKNLSFDVGGGKMNGSASYNFANRKFKANVSASNVDSNKVASNLFGIKDQIFGLANGSIVISTNGATEEERIKNMVGNVYFEIVDGKMPKLGSVEYLLKAGNLIKSGITGASLNNFISLLAPIKTGYFDSIKGNFALKNGVAQNIEVYSKGENLNLFINGDYDLLIQYADLRVFGRLTRKAVNILGPVGNLSFNSLLNAIPGLKFDNNEKNSIIKEINKIPGVELSDKDYRVFTVKLDGHFNDDKFVKNFRWVE